MFTGIVQELGSVVAAEGDENGLELRIVAPNVAPGVVIGGSVSVNGCCLTVETIAGDELTFHAVPETLRRTCLGGLTVGARVNLEPALRAGEPLGGHLVQGHIDGIGSVVDVTPEGEGRRLRIDAPYEVGRYCVDKGSVVVDGVSLTVAALTTGGFEVALIPHTLAETTLSELRPGSRVNLEADVLAKYVERLLGDRRSMS